MNAENDKMINIDALGDVCPIPVVKAKNALKELNGTGEVVILVDNEIAVQNLWKMAVQKGYECSSSRKSEWEYEVHIVVKNPAGGNTMPVESAGGNTADRSRVPEECVSGNSVNGESGISAGGEIFANCAPCGGAVAEDVTSRKRRVVAIGSNQMGSGSEKLGKTLMKGFLYALARQEELPVCILFYNSGAYLTCEGSDSLEDLRMLYEEGTEILTCGTCLDYYELKEKLSVGGVTNMYAIAEIMTGADVLIKP